MLPLLWTRLIGLAAGAVGKLILPGEDPGGGIPTLVLGLAGPLLGARMGQALGRYREGQGVGFLMSVAGVLILSGAYPPFTRSRA